MNHMQSILALAPPVGPKGQRQGPQLWATCHWCFAPLVSEHHQVGEQYWGLLPTTCSSCPYRILSSLVWCLIKQRQNLPFLASSTHRFSVFFSLAPDTPTPLSRWQNHIPTVVAALPQGIWKPSILLLRIPPSGLHTLSSYRLRPWLLPAPPAW